MVTHDDQSRTGEGVGAGKSYGFRKSADAVKAAVPIEYVAQRYTEITPLGGKAWGSGRCPLPDHDDSTPSFYLYPDGRFYCFGCGRGGDVIDLEFFCGSYGALWEAMIALAHDYGVELPRRPESWHRRNQEKYGPGGVYDQVTAVRANVRRRRLFRLFIEPELMRIGNLEERRQEAERAWSELQRMPL